MEVGGKYQTQKGHRITVETVTFYGPPGETPLNNVTAETPPSNVTAETPLSNITAESPPSNVTTQSRALQDASPSPVPVSVTSL